MALSLGKRFFFRKKHLVYDVKKCNFVELRILSYHYA